MAIKDSPANKFIIIIAGPTAVGKTAISIKLALDFGAEIFSADSRQIYREMNIGTAKPNDNELNVVRHHFINHVSIEQQYSVGQYEKEIKSKLNQYFENHDVAIVCGGTGLYIKALTEGLDDFPDITDDITNFYQDQYNLHGLDWLQNELLVKDPIYYNVVDKANHRRLMRALCVIMASGLPYSTMLSNSLKNKVPYNFISIMLDIPRDELYQRINNRVDNMINAGLEDEARQLFKSRGLRSLETVGYQELFDYFEGATDLNTAIDLIKQNSRRYAKRQMTWFRKYGKWQIFSPKKEEEIKAYIEAKIYT